MDAIYVFYARWRLSHIMSTCMGGIVSQADKDFIVPAFWNAGASAVAQVRHSEHAVLTLTLPLGPTDTVCV